jgi:hypothetical protein
LKSKNKQLSINGNTLKDGGNKYNNATKPIQDDIQKFSLLFTVVIVVEPQVTIFIQSKRLRIPVTITYTTNSMTFKEGHFL